MAKKQKNNTTKNETTAFSKEDWYGGSRRSRRNKNKKQKGKHSGSDSYKPAVKANKVILTNEEVLQSMIDRQNELHPELDRNS